MSKFKLFIMILIIAASMFSMSCNKNEPETIVQDPLGTQNANPLLPGYYADPSVCKFEDTYYIYGTTGGLEFNNGGSMATPCVWQSKDFVHWTASEIDVKTSRGGKYTFASFWAPSVMEHNGKYYLTFTLNDHDTIFAQSNSPAGPFTVLGNVYEKTEWKDYKTIDAQFFKDDDGKVYIAHLINIQNTLHTGISELDPENIMNVIDSVMVEESENFVNVYREGQEIIKKDGKYYMFYSTGTWTGSEYMVRYAVADNVKGPYKDMYAILRTNTGETVKGPGHTSTLYENGKYYIVYHRHIYPFVSFNYRQTCSNELIFKENGEIEFIEADHKIGAGQLAEDPKYSDVKNVAVGADISTQMRNVHFDLKHMIDENNGTIWKCMVEQLPDSILIDLKKEYQIQFTQIYFEYVIKYYRYKLEYSADNENWEIYSDQSENEEKRMPMEDNKEVTARYFRLTLEEPQKMTGAYQTTQDSDVRTINRDKPHCGIFEFKIFAKK